MTDYQPPHVHAGRSRLKTIVDWLVGDPGAMPESTSAPIYRPPETALHHLKMANAYYLEAVSKAKPGEEALPSTSDIQLRLLVDAANHLEKARSIDPSEVLWVEDHKANEKYRVTQDFLAGSILTLEGMAHLNTARYWQNHYIDLFGRLQKENYSLGVSSLNKARDTLEKAYSYHSIHAAKYLLMAYKYLGDAENYKRVLIHELEIHPDDIELHKQYNEFSQMPHFTPIFVKPFPITLNMFLGIGMLVGAILIYLGAIALGIVLFIGFLIPWLIKLNREN